MEEKKKVENDQIDDVNGGVIKYDPREPKCFKCRSQRIQRMTLFNSPGIPKRYIMTCLDCGYSWTESEDREKLW